MSRKFPGSRRGDQPIIVPDDALEADIAILGKKGRGKTYAAKGLVERLLDMGRRVIVLDPLSTWWGLKAGPDGFAIPVLGGPHGDLPLTDQDGTALGQHLAAAASSAVLDLGAMRKAEMIRFAGAFLEELYTRNRDPLWLVLEEADVFAPQQPMNDTARMLGEVDRIARRGRQFGFRLISLTQRPAKLHKDVLTQLSTLIVLGITSPQDRDAVKAWVEGNADRDQAKAVVDSLASLKVGEGWVWAPDLDLLKRLTFPAIRTLDTSATPKAGAPTPTATLRADVDIDALRAALVSREPVKTVPENSSATSPADPDRERRAEQRGFEAGIRASAAHIQHFSLEWTGKLTDGGQTPFERSAKHPVGFVFVDAILSLLDPDKRSASRAPIMPSPEQTPFSPAHGIRAQKVDNLNSASRKMLSILDTNPPVRRSWHQVATLAGLRARGGHFNAGRRALIDGRLVTEDGGLVAVAAPTPGAGPAQHDPAALVATWCAALSGAAPRILRALFDSDVDGWTKAEIADALGVQPRGGHWNAGWKELRDNGLVQMDGDRVRLAAVFGDAATRAKR